MNIYNKYNLIKNENKYNEYLLYCVKEHFMDKKIEINNEFECHGKGNCFNNIPGTYIFYKNKRCTKNCVLEKCPNFILCKNYIPKFMLEEYYDICYPCSIQYKPCGNGKGILKTFINHECEKCGDKTECIECSFCDHIFCMQCFKLCNLYSKKCLLCK